MDSNGEGWFSVSFPPPAPLKNRAPAAGWIARKPVESQRFLEMLST
jgi:hypothetical protein